jgi:prepilin-type N-terminal cleavage/methylation domain-containing protein
MKPDVSPGFSMVELAITLVVIGVIVAFSVPAYHNITASQQLKGAGENIAAQLRLARERAIATGVDQPMHFVANWNNSDYHLHLATGEVPMKWSLPKGITYAVVGVNPTMKRDGRSNASGIVVLQDTRGNRDSVSVQLSGLVLTR